MAKDEERQSPARSFMILQICGKQLHRSVICGATEAFTRLPQCGLRRSACAIVELRGVGALPGTFAPSLPQLTVLAVGFLLRYSSGLGAQPQRRA